MWAVKRFSANVRATSNNISVLPPSLGRELRELLQSGAGADVILACGGERIAAHSFVLCLRSPVFRAQLAPDSPMVVADRTSVPVPDAITPATLRRLLEFIYSDELEPESPEEAGARLTPSPPSQAAEAAPAAQAQHLLNAADHYALPRLLSICERVLRVGLGHANAVHTLVLSHQHSARALKAAALRFVAAHATALMQTDGWSNLMATQPALLNEVRVCVCCVHYWFERLACMPPFFMRVLYTMQLKRSPVQTIRCCTRYSLGSHRGSGHDLMAAATTTVLRKAESAASARGMSDASAFTAADGVSGL